MTQAQLPGVGNQLTCGKQTGKQTAHSNLQTSCQLLEALLLSPQPPWLDTSPHTGKQPEPAHKPC